MIKYNNDFYTISGRLHSDCFHLVDKYMGHQLEEHLDQLQRTEKFLPFSHFMNLPFYFRLGQRELTHPTLRTAERSVRFNFGHFGTCYQN